MLNHRYLRFWCQKVLPLVYDDSLSYYELLCKVVAYLNNLTKDVVQLTEEVAGIEDRTLRKIAEELQRMVNDGTLADILESIALDGRLVTGKYLEDSPKMPDSYTLYPNLSSVTASDIYQWYDDLLDAHRDSMNKISWGRDEDNEPLAYYTFSCDSNRKTALASGEPTGEVSYTRSSAYTSNRIVLFSGIHGNEKQNAWTLFNIVKAIVEGNGSAYDYIKQNVNLTIVPCVNPYGLTHNSKYNKNDVDINRNFPHGWEEYNREDSAHKGSSAGSELSTQFCMDIITGINSKNSHNGTVIIDFHDFEGRDGVGEPDSSAAYYFMAGANDPEFRIALTKAGMKVMKYFEANYHEVIALSERPIRVISNTYTPSLVNYAYYLGFRYASTIENRTHIFETQYDEATHNSVYYSCALTIASVALGFVASKRITEIMTLADIGCDENSSLEDVLKAMPPMSHFSINVYNTISLWDDMPTFPLTSSRYGILEITTSNEIDEVNAVLEYSAKSQDYNYKWYATAYQSGSSVIVTGWVLEQFEVLGRDNFTLGGEFGANFMDLVGGMIQRQSTMLVLKVSTSFTNLVAELPSSVGTLTIIASYTADRMISGMAFYGTSNGLYYRTINSDISYTDWVKVTTTPVE